MAGESPLVALALVVGLPMLINHSAMFKLALLRPRWSSRRSAFSSPVEALLALIVGLLFIYHGQKLYPWSESYRAAQDVFRHTSLPIGISSNALRSRLASASLEELGLTQYRLDSPEGSQEEGDVMDRLLLRLSSMAGRQLYLLVGPAPLLSCQYCKQPLDFQLFAVPSMLLRYALHLLAIGLLSLSQPTLNTLDGCLLPLSPLRRQPNGTGSINVTTAVEKLKLEARANSRAWRAPAAILLTVMLLLQGSVLMDSWGWSDRQTSIWNHWHHNVYIVRHVTFLLLPLLVYIYPSPAQTKVPTTMRIAASLGAINNANNVAQSHLAWLETGREVTWKDRGMREAVGSWYDEQGQQQNTGQHKPPDRARDVLGMAEREENG